MTSDEAKYIGYNTLEKKQHIKIYNCIIKTMQLGPGFLMQQLNAKPLHMAHELGIWCVVKSHNT